MFRPERPTARQGLVGVIIVAIIAMASFGALQSVHATDRAIRQQLKNRASTIAALLDQDDVIQLTGSDSDATADYYLRLKRTLADLKTYNTDIRSLYITERKGDKLYFYVDSEDPKSDYYSPPGEYYPDATPLFKGVFTSNAAAVEGPTKDDFGTWVSGLAPIRTTDDAVVAVLGMDIDAGYYYKTIVQAALVPVLLGLFVVAVILTYERIRLRDQRFLRMRSELVSVASHELRSPLSGIRWATEGLMVRLRDADKIAANRILVSTSKLQVAVDDILQLSHLQGKGSKLDIQEVDLAAMLRDICDIQSLTAAQKAVHLQLDDSWKTPVMVRCDASRMKRALHNVISNAVKYTRDGTSVEIHYTKTDEWHQITVVDHGIGIPTTEQEKVFSGFYRASNAKALNIEGTGMGLYLARGIIEQHGGTLTMESQQDVGTTMTMKLPV